MQRPKSADDGLTKFQRYRQQQQHRGMKQLRIWVPDPHRPEFVGEAKRQGLLLGGRPEEADALGFIAAAIERPELRNEVISSRFRRRAIMENPARRSSI